MSNVERVIQADLTYLEGGFERDVQVVVDDSGVIRGVGRLGRRPDLLLPGRALLPGLVDAHSHAFQRALRGCGEKYPAGQGDFWSWRQAMYGLADRIRPDEFRHICRQAFDEMLSAGITTVGEFHYLHHVDPEARDFGFDDALLDAADGSGIRLVLLLSYYRTGGVGRPLEGAQRRFATDSVEGFARQLERLAARLGGRQSLGIAPHSIRAAAPEDLRRLRELSRRLGLVLHMHVEEQPREVDECRAALGVTPLRWIVEHLDVGADFTIVHATHSADEDIRRYVASGGNVCVCPLTEGSLGDGIADLSLRLGRPEAVCVGSDSNVRIDLVEELRWLELVQRLRAQRRGVCRGADGDVGRQLLRCGTENGARALGLSGVVGRIAPGWRADLVALDLSSPSLAGWAPDTLLPMFLLGAGKECVREVLIDGRPVR